MATTINPNSALAQEFGLSSIEFGEPEGKIVEPSTAAEELGISTNPITTFNSGEYLKNLKKTYIDVPAENIKDASEQANQFAVDQVTDTLAEELRSQGYKIDIDWKGLKNLILGRDAQGKQKPVKSPQKNRQELGKFLDKIPGSSARRFILKTILKSGAKIASPVIQAFQEDKIEDEIIIKDRLPGAEIEQAKNISEYFNALRKWNNDSFKAGDFKTSPQVSDKNVFKANENRFNVLEKVTRAINENNTFDTKNKALKNVEDQFLKGELTQPTAGKGTKNQRSAFVSYQKLAEKDILNKFGEHTPQHILDAFANNVAFKKGKTSTARSKRGVPFVESEDGTKLISFMKNRFNKPNTLEELSSDILKEQNIVSLKGILENTARVEFQDYIKQISHKLPENVLKNYRDYASQRGLGGVATIEQKLALSPLATLLEGKIQKIPTSAKVPKNVKEQIARNNLAAFQEAHAQVPELVSKIRPLDRDLLRKRATDLQNYKDIYGEKNLLSHKEIAKIYGLKKRRELDRILGKELDFKNPLDRKIFNLQKKKLDPYKGQQFSGARAHPLETQWWKDLPETSKEIFRYPVDPTLSPINAFHQRLNKLFILSKEKRLDAIKRDDRKEIFRLDKNLKKIEDYIKELRITTTLPTGETISAYPPGTSLQHKMRMLVENQKELIKILDIAKSDVNKMFERKEGIKDGGVIGFDEGGKFGVSSIEFGEPEGKIVEPKLTGKEYQHFFEEGVGDKVGSLRTLGTLWKGRLLTGASSGFGNEYAAENLPILKDMDPLSRGIWNTIAPYGEKAFDVVDTLFRLPGSFVADTFEGFGVDEDKANKLQAEINTMLAMPVAGGPTSAAGRMKSLKTVSDTAKKLKNIEKSSDNIIGPMPLGEVVNMPQPLGKAKEVGLGFKSKLNPNTKKLELYQEGELVGSFDSIADAQSTMKQINAGKWKGKSDYKTTKSKINQGWEIRFPGQTNTMNFKTKKDAQLYIKNNYADTIPENLPTVHKVDKGKGAVVIKDKKGDFSRYSLMFEDIQTNYSPKEIKTANQWIGELKNRGHTKELDKGGFGYTLFKKGNEKLSAEDLFKLRKEKGSQLNTETIRMGNTDTINLLGEFDSIHIEYVDSLVPMGGFTARNPSKWGSLPGKTQKYIKDKVDNFANYYKNFLERNDGRLTATQDDVLNGRIDKVLAEITIAAEKAGGGNAWSSMLTDFNAPNFSSNVLQAAGDVLSKTQMGAASRRFLTNLKNLRRDYGVTRDHANLTLPGKAQKTHRTDVYTYNPIKGQVNTSDVVTTHMGQRNELAHVRKTDRSSLDGQNGVLLDEIQFDVLKNVAKNDKAVFKAETMGGQADALAEQVKTLEAQRARVKNLELKKLIVKSDIEPVMDYNLPRNQRALIEEAKTIPDDSPMMAEIINKIEQEGDVGDWLMNNSKAYAKIENELARIEKEFSGTVTAKTGMPDIPFRQHEEMLGEIFKIEIGKAIENNKDFVAIPLPEVVFGYESATGGNMAVAFNNIYRKNSLRALKTLQENYKKRLESLGIDGEAFKITSGDDVNIWLSWDKNSSTSDGFMSKINAMKREHGIDNAEEFYKKLNSGQIDRNQMPLLPFEIGEMPGGKIAVKPGIVIDLRNMNGFDRKQLAKIGFKEYKEGGSTNINKYSALAGIDILGVAI